MFINVFGMSLCWLFQIKRNYHCNHITCIPNTKQNSCGTWKDVPLNIFHAWEMPTFVFWSVVKYSGIDSQQPRWMKLYFSFSLFSAKSVSFLMACDIWTRLQFIQPPQDFKSFVTLVIGPNREAVFIFSTDATRKWKKLVECQLDHVLVRSSFQLSVIKRKLTVDIFMIFSPLVV